jgi:hypothetical protein
VEKGLAIGDLVAAAGSFKLRDGLLVPVSEVSDIPGPAAMN